MLVTKENYFNFFGYSIFNIATGSMEPTLSQNDAILVKKSNKYKVDDIVTFKSDDAYVTHRIVSISGHDIVTQGDANNVKDVAIKDTAIIGKVVKIFPNGGVWQKVLTTPKVIILVFITLILFDFAFSYNGHNIKKSAKLAKEIENISLEKTAKNKDAPKITKAEIKEIYRKADSIKKGEKEVFDKKEQDFLDYTIRLDLNRIQEEIDESLKSVKK